MWTCNYTWHSCLPPSSGRRPSRNPLSFPASRQPSTRVCWVTGTSMEQDSRCCGWEEGPVQRGLGNDFGGKSGRSGSWRIWRRTALKTTGQESVVTLMWHSDTESFYVEREHWWGVRLKMCTGLRQCWAVSATLRNLGSALQAALVNHVLAGDCIKQYFLVIRDFFELW